MQGWLVMRSWQHSITREGMMDDNLIKVPLEPMRMVRKLHRKSMRAPEMSGHHIVHRRTQEILGVFHTAHQCVICQQEKSQRRETSLALDTQCAEIAFPTFVVSLMIDPKSRPPAAFCNYQWRTRCFRVHVSKNRLHRQPSATWCAKRPNCLESRRERIR